ncbi:MAG: PIN domain-containing protein, partial [Chloroflexota bacterium]
RQRMARIFEDGDEPYVNEIVVCEVRAGLLAKDVPGFDSTLRSVAFVQPGPPAALAAGKWRAEARNRGRVLSLGDALIAAAAHSLEAAVLTRNVRDFSLAPVPVETY